MPPSSPPVVLGLDFGTTDSVAAVARGGVSELVPLAGPDGSSPVFRSALRFWEEVTRVAVEAGPWAIREYLEYPEGSRFIQSFKTVAASPSFEHATIFERRYSFEDLGRTFLRKMGERSGGALGGPADVWKADIGAPSMGAQRLCGGLPDAPGSSHRFT